MHAVAVATYHWEAVICEEDVLWLQVSMSDIDRVELFYCMNYESEQVLDELGRQP